ncbi:MAG: hypothetical protein ACR2NG_00605 [Acidimicrobiia bacterium]
MTQRPIRMMLGTALAVAAINAAGCSTQEMGADESLQNDFCSHVQGGQDMTLMESFTANPNLDDAQELREQSVEYNRMAEVLAPPEIADAVARAAPGMVDLIDLMVSTSFDPSLADPAETERVGKSVEDSLAATDEVNAWVDANC